MRCLVTAGPTCEPLDEVRRLTNFSTGRLGCELASFLTGHGHEVTLLLGEQATWGGECRASQVIPFTSTADLQQHLEQLSRDARIEAVFHAAAVSDFRFCRIFRREADGSLSEVRARKIPTREGRLLAELEPTPKLLSLMRGWFPTAHITGWKYEMDGDRDSVLALARQQIDACDTNACVVNGRAYGEGFGLVTAPGEHVHLPDRPALYKALALFTP